MRVYSDIGSKKLVFESDDKSARLTYVMGGQMVMSDATIDIPRAQKTSTKLKKEVSAFLASNEVREVLGL